MPEPCPPARFHLAPHPASPDTVIDTITCELAWHHDQLAVRFALTGTTAGLRLPPPAHAGPADGLWQHTCCELFLAHRGDSAYLEFNFSPSSAWARYAFSAPRQRIDVATPEGLAPHIACTLDAGTVVLNAHVPRGLLSPLEPERKALDVALCCVTERLDGERAWWALRHLAPRPDFHLRDGFMPLCALPPSASS